MPRRNKTRRLWLHIKFYAPQTSESEVIRTLRNSIARGDYRYPRGWKVAIGWRNSLRGDMKWGEFTHEMTNSRKSSSGFEDAVDEYLRTR